MKNRVTLRWRLTIVGALLLALAMLAAGCGSSSSSSSSTSEETTETTEATEASETTTTASNTVTVPFTGPETSLPTSYPTPEEKGSMTIGFLDPTSAQEGLRAIQSAIEKEAGNYGATVKALDANLSVDQQVSQMQTLIDEKVSAIIVDPLDPKALAPIISHANAAGIPVIGIQATLTPTEKPEGMVSQVWEGPDKNAYDIATAIATTQPEAQLGLIGFAIPVPYISELVERVGYWAEKMGLTVLGEADNKDDSIPGGEAAATGLLGQYPEMNALFTYNENSGIGAYTAVRSAGRQNDVKIYSNNGTTEGIEAVREGKIAITFQFPMLSVGELAAQAAIDAVNGTKIPATVVVPSSQEINSENAEEATTWTEQLKEGG